MLRKKRGSSTISVFHHFEEVETCALIALKHLGDQKDQKLTATTACFSLMKFKELKLLIHEISAITEYCFE